MKFFFKKKRVLKTKIIILRSKFQILQIIKNNMILIN